MRNTMILTLSLFVWSLPGIVQAGGVNVKPPNTGGKEPDKWLKDLFEQKVKQVPAHKAALCKICKKPLFEHSNDNFVCEPLDKTVQRIKRVSVTCPVCTSVFKAAKKDLKNINDKQGLDRDFCRHSSGKIAVHASIWMCPTCGYAARQKTFGRELDGTPLSAKSKEIVRSQITKSTQAHLINLTGLRAIKGKAIPKSYLQFARYLKQTSIKDWVKYENAILLLNKSTIKAPHALRAKYHLEAAHANRRFLCSEIGISGLHPQIQISLGHAIRRINGFIQGECLRKRLANKETDLAPNEPEVDPAKLSDAASFIFEQGQKIIHNATQRSRNGSTADVARFTTGDVYMLHIRHAGFLARMGKLKGATELLLKARKIIPSTSTDGMPEKTKIYFENQKTLLREIVAQRIKAINRERMHLYRAADELMQAMFFNERKNLDLAINSYLVGELLRRDGRELHTAKAWFKLSEELLVNGVGGQSAKQRTQLTSWVKEQSNLLKDSETKKELDPKIIKAIAQIRARGLQQKLGKTVVSDPKKPKTAPTPQPQKITRRALLAKYFEALSTFAKEKKRKASKLSELVEGGYLKKVESYLKRNADSGAMKLYCPEDTTRKLLFSKNAELGDKSALLIFPLSKDPDQTSLFGDGSIRKKK